MDTIDGALMMTLYTSTAMARDQIAITYYSIVLTLITVVVAFFIGIVQVLNLALNVAEPQGRFWDGVGALGDHYDIVGELCAPRSLPDLFSPLEFSHPSLLAHAKTLAQFPLKCDE